MNISVKRLISISLIVATSEFERRKNERNYRRGQAQAEEPNHQLSQGHAQIFLRKMLQVQSRLSGNQASVQRPQLLTLSRNTVIKKGIKKMGICEVLTIVFVVLKLMHIIEWSWLLVLLPEIIAVVFYVVLLVVNVALDYRIHKQIRKDFDEFDRF